MESGAKTPFTPTIRRHKSSDQERKEERKKEIYFVQVKNTQY